MATKRVKKNIANQHGLGDAPESWSWYAGGPLRGCALARERHSILAWDDGNIVYLFHLFGDLIAQRRFDKEIASVAASDNGEAIIVALRSGAVFWLDRDLDVCFQHSMPFDCRTVAVDGHGYYTAVAGTGGQIVVLGRDSKKVSQFETRPPLKYLAFLPSDGQIVGAGDHGLLGCYDLVGRAYWETHPFSNCGGFTVDGAGGAFFLASHGHGLIRYGDEGAKEGTYRLEGSPALVAVDFEARKIITTTLEKTLVELTYEGSVVASRSLPDLPVGLAIDALGRYLVIAYQQGELRFSTIKKFFKHDDDDNHSAAEPTWSATIAQSIEESESVDLAPIPQTASIAVYSNRKVIRIFDGAGALAHQTVGLPGVGRSLAPGLNWIAGATDAYIAGYNPADNTSIRSSSPMSEISHLEPLGEFGDLIVIQSCEYVSRLKLPDDEVFQLRLDRRVESAAVTPAGSWAVALDDKTMRTFNSKGEVLGKFRPSPEEPLLVAAGADGWVTLGRQTRILRGHEMNGKVLWSFEVPWAAWGLQPVGEFFVATAVDGSSLLVDQEGEIVYENRDPRQNARYFAWKDGRVGRLFNVGTTILATEFSGKEVYRRRFEGKLGAFTASSQGFWIVIERQLQFFAW